MTSSRPTWRSVCFREESTAWGANGFDGMSVQNNVPSTPPGGITGRGFLPGQSGNPGGRPTGLARRAREAVHDGADLVDFMAAVLKGDTKTLGVKVVPLRDRLQAAAWFGDRGWGKVATVIEPPDAPAGSLSPEMATELREMPPELKDGIRQWLQQRRDEWLAREREAAERRMLEFMPTDGPNGNGAQ